MANDDQQYVLVHAGAILAVTERRSNPPKDGDFSDEFPSDCQWVPISDAHHHLLTDREMRPIERSRDLL